MNSDYQRRKRRISPPSPLYRITMIEQGIKAKPANWFDRHNVWVEARLWWLLGISAAVLALVMFWPRG